jgi:hypothetical protein
VLNAAPVGEWKSLKVPLKCFQAAGTDVTKVDAPFALSRRQADGVAAGREADDGSGGRGVSGEGSITTPLIPAKAGTQAEFQGGP